jgi:hypothetical protein
LRDEIGDREVGEDRSAEIAMQDAPGPVAELDEEGPFETEALADALDIGGGRLARYRGG